MNQNGKGTGIGEVETGAEDFKLLVQSQEAGQAVIPTRWCVSPKLAAQIATRDAEAYGELCLGVIIAQTGPDGKEIVGGRQVLNLENAMTYVAFRKPGVNRLHAWLISTTDRDSCRGTEYGGGWRRTYLSCSGYRYRFSLFDYDGRPYTDEKIMARDSDGKIFGYHTVEVSVAEEFFAKPLPRWLATWVNGFCDGEPMDECQFRKRFIFAFTLQPIAVVIVYLYRLGVLTYLLLWGAIRDIRWRNFSKWYLSGEQFHGDLSPNWRLRRRSIFKTDKDGFDRHWLLSLYLPWLVMLWAGLGAVGFGVWNRIIPEQQYRPWSSGALLAPLVPLGIWLIIKCAQVILKVWRRAQLTGWWKKLTPKKPFTRETKATTSITSSVSVIAESRDDALAQRRMAALAELRPLTCSREPLKVDIRDLPELTLRLRFQDLKSRICRPFAQK